MQGMPESFAVFSIAARSVMPSLARAIERNPAHPLRHNVGRVRRQLCEIYRSAFGERCHYGQRDPQKMGAGALLVLWSRVTRSRGAKE
jgi:hypothetical protein